MFQVVVPLAASRGNRLLALELTLPVSSPLLCILSGCGNAAARWSVSGSLTRTELLKTLPPAGLGKEEAVCSVCTPLPPCQCGGEGEREAERLSNRESTRERGKLPRESRGRLRNTFYKSKKEEDRRRGTLSMSGHLGHSHCLFFPTCLQLELSGLVVPKQWIF